MKLTKFERNEFFDAVKTKGLNHREFRWGGVEGDQSPLTHLPTSSYFDFDATRVFLAKLAEYKAVKEGNVAIGLIGMRVDARTRSATELEAFVSEYDFPYVTNLRDTQAYVHAARDGMSVFDMPRSRVEQDWEQWRTLTRWIAKQVGK